MQQDQYDLDGDGEADTTALGFIVTPPDGGAPYFQRQDQAPPELVQGVWLSSVHDVGAIEGELANGQTTTLPDLTRLPDWSADFDDRALLSSLSLEDLRDTDLYVFRESDGSLLIERRGLDERETSLIGADAERQRFFYTLRLLGGKGMNAMTMASGAAGFAQFQEAEGLLDPAQYQRAADHLRAGEYVRIIAINRPSGYMGSLSVPLQAAGSGADPTEISFPIDELVMRPPNLKIWAERQSQVAVGLTRGETREQAIGNEGAGLADDVLISLYTEWLDADGRPLPEALGEYGYTGRLAKVVAPNQLAPVEGSFSECDPACGEDGNQLSQFAIRPGRQLQVVRLPEAVQGKQHLYVHVSGTPASREPDFGSGGQAGSVLEFRPAKFVPVQVPVYDEETTHLALQVYNGLRADDPNRDLTRPAPFYRFVYRPEFQFSLYDLAVQEIRRTDVAGQTTDVLPLTQPVLTSADQLVELYYDLLGPTLGDEPLPPLAPYSYAGERELVFALGEQELRATVGADGTLRFDNLDHLGLLNPEDYLTIRLYSNNDAGNVLWEWAFEYLAVDTLKDVNDQLDENGTIYITADDTELPLQAVLIGYANRDPEEKREKRLSWHADGNATLMPPVQVDADLGVFNTLLTMPTVADSHATIKARLDSGDETAEVVFGTVVVEPGKPASISLEAEGEVTALGVSKMTVTATVRDRYGNRVKDGTPILFAIAGGADQEETDSATQSGEASTVITGGEFASTDNTLTVRAGEVETQLPFTVKPLQVTIASFDTRPYIGTTLQVPVQVKDSSGEPAAGVTVKIASTYGIVREEELLTDSQGRVTANIVNPPNPGQATLTVRVGFTAFDQQSYEVILPPGYTQNLDARRALVVGDQTAADMLIHERYDGTQIALDYPVEAPIGLAGTAGQTLTVQIGDLADPNLAPLAAYFMTDLDLSDTGSLIAPDATGLHAAVAEHVEVVQDHPLGAGRSYRFRKSIPLDEDTRVDSSLRVESLPALAKPTDVGFRLDVKPESADAVIFDYHGGSQRLSYDAAGRFRYRIDTSQGPIEVASAAAAPGTWHTVAGRYRNGALELEVDGTLYQTSGTAEVTYVGSATLMVGGFVGNLSGLQFYDWTSAPLLALAGGGVTQTATLDENGAGSISVRSLGHLNDQQAGSMLPMLRVAVVAGGTRQYVSLLSSALYTEIGGYYVDHLHPNPPPLNLAALSPGYGSGGYAAPLLDFVVRPAYAWDFSLSGVGDWISEAVNFFIPYRDIGMLFKQLGYLATDDPNFNEDDLVTGLIGTLSVIPIAKGLNLAKPLVKFALFAKRINPRFLGKFISVLDRTLEKAWNSRSFNAFIDLLPFLLVAGELAWDLATDEEARLGLELIVKSIESEDDLWAWIDYVRLPTDGWEGGEADMPQLQLVANGSAYQPDVMLAQAGLLDLLVPKAHAVSPMKGLRVGAQQLKIVLKAVRRLGNELTGARLDKLIDGLKGLVAGMKQTQWSPIRAVTHSKQAFIAAMTMGSVAARKVLREAKTLRLSPLTIMAIITYLESRRNCGDIPGCQPHTEEVNERLTGLYGSFITKALLRDDGSVKGNNENGALFHLAMLALKHFEYEMGFKESRVLAIEREIEVPLHYKDRLGQYKKWNGPHPIRKVDIVLAGEAGNTEVNAKAVWLEVKSYKSPLSSSSFGIWTGTKDTRNRNHREFFLDRVAITTNTLASNAPALAKDFQWRFQDFNNKRANEKGPNATDIDNVRTWQVRLPKLSSGTEYVSLGYRSAAENNNGLTVAPIKNNIQLQNVKTWVLGLARQALLEGVSDEIILQVIEAVE